jgi:hypothetical protein
MRENTKVCDLCFREVRRKISSSNERRTQAAIRKHDVRREGREKQHQRRKRPSRCIALASINAKKVEKRGQKSTKPTTQKQAQQTTPQELIHQASSGPLVEEPAAAFRAFLLRLLLQARKRGYHRPRTAATAKRFCDAAAEFAAKTIRGCTACAGDGAVAGGGADFGGFEAFFYGCELGFETVRCLLAMFDVVWGDGRKRTDGWLA